MCGICDGVFVQPHSCPEGHTYCEPCLKTWVREKKTLHPPPGHGQECLEQNILFLGLAFFIHRAHRQSGPAVVH